MGSYKYYSSSASIRRTPQAGYVADYQALIDKQFSNASNLFTIQEETTLGSGIYQDTSVIIQHIVQSNTGQKEPDDFKEIIFNPISTYTMGLGCQYKFDSNTWLTVATDHIKYVTMSSVVRRCNNVLKWVYDGSIHSESTIVDYGITYNGGDYNKVISLPTGTIKIYCQGNIRTNLIDINQRFLIGSEYQCWKVQSINNFNASTTTANDSPILEFTLIYDTINDANDNLTLGIADYYNNYIDDIIPSAGYVNIVTPNITFLKQGQVQVFEVWEYNNGVKTATKFDISASGVLSPYFTLTGTSSVNTFTVTNVKYEPDNPLIITCTNLRDASTETLSINLRLF